MKAAQWQDDDRKVIRMEREEIVTYFVPDDPTLPHRQEVAAWEAEGNTIADPPPSPALKIPL